MLPLRECQGTTRVQGQVCETLEPKGGSHTTQLGRELADCKSLTAHRERPWLIEISVSAGVCPAVPSTVYLPLATTPMPTGGAPGDGRLQLLPGMCTAARGALRPSPRL